MISPALLGRVCRTPVILRGIQQIQPLSASSPRGMEDLECRNAMYALLLDRLYTKCSSIAAHWQLRDGHISTSPCPLSLLLLRSAITWLFIHIFNILNTVRYGGKESVRAEPELSTRRVQWPGEGPTSGGDPSRPSVGHSQEGSSSPCYHMSEVLLTIN